MPTEYSPRPRDTIGDAKQTSTIDPAAVMDGAIEVTVHIEKRELRVSLIVLATPIREAVKGCISCSEIVVIQTICFKALPSARAVRMAEYGVRPRYSRPV